MNEVRKIYENYLKFYNEFYNESKNLISDEEVRKIYEKFNKEKIQKKRGNCAR
jgi:hypothetical protein